MPAANPKLRRSASAYPSAPPFAPSQINGQTIQGARK